MEMTLDFRTPDVTPDEGEKVLIYTDDEEYRIAEWDGTCFNAFFFGMYAKNEVLYWAYLNSPEET